ncbi:MULTISPECIES: DUF6007 family protein [Staphylococcus]|jgi:hypothetical protein|uniref:DUF6007 family protein n=1 Tax=Staphylococcus TaxID=1279 RepID=UPI000F88E087|nr:MULTISPECIES: DUF6007 family protein [Staphylococcus]MCH4302832.1 DUF6007 family protein [Staphylococcus haemolyticus]MCH4309295.1 DUF6007 family protein [Staphylococcus haemolyticus]MCH4311652.1 DUF6007 family protein [Staphylococcus haemolyticus]MCH4425893.1 DUF6007 family protein [Staphylococcus haemolyticus]MCH4447024.1 DUF6007 family protein [Staphylococcus haemolyticus]
MKNTNEFLTTLSWWDLLLTIPVFLLFTYLPTYNFFCILLNIIIIIFFSIGLILTTHILWNYFKR